MRATAAGDAVTVWVRFELDGQAYALPIDAVREILRPVAIEPVPGTTALVCGVINLRGSIVTVFDLRRRLGRDAVVVPAGADRQRILIFTPEREAFGIRVDAVTQIVKLPSSSVQPAPAVGSMTDAAQAAGVVCADDGLLTLLDPRQLIDGLRCVA